MNNKQAKLAEKTIRDIARTTLDLETLETRGRDRLDFSEQPVFQIAEALVKAYQAGYDAGRGNNNK